MWWQLLVGVVAGLVLCWVLLVAVLAWRRPRGLAPRELVRLLPDLLRLVTRMARDNTLPRGVRWRLAGLGAYLAFPFDLVPDFIPVLGYADDAIVVALVLRSVVRRAGAEAVDRHWPGSPEGLAAVHVLVSRPG